MFIFIVMTPLLYVSQQATLEETIQQLQRQNDLRMQKEVKNILFSLGWFLVSSSYLKNSSVY